MKDRASFTASMIAVARGLSRVLPEDARLVDDPYGERFSTPALDFVRKRAAGWLFPVIEGTLLTVQLRTFLIDQLLMDFVKGGGDQILLLGAGFDARASRFAELLANALVFEVDHPSTQAIKRERLSPPANVRFLPWDFEQQPVDGLPAALAAQGHDPQRRTLTIWEGVTMYLSEGAVDASVRAVAALSAPQSPFVLTYFDASAIRKPGLGMRLARALVAGLAEPLTFGFEPEALGAWIGARGFSLQHDVTIPDAARGLLPARYAPGFTDGSLHFAFLRRDDGTVSRDTP